MRLRRVRTPRVRNALAVSLAETGGGALLILGAATPLAAALLNGSMFTAIRKVHLEKGVWNTSGGYEYNLVLIATVTAIVDDPGRPSVDDALGIRDSGTGWALAAVAAGAAGSALAVELGKRAELEPEPGRRFVREPEEVPAGATA